MTDPTTQALWREEALLRHAETIEIAYPVGPLMEEGEAQVGGGHMGVAVLAPPPAGPQQPVAQQPIAQGPATHPSLIHPSLLAQQQAVPQPAIQPSAPQQPAAQPANTRWPCPSIDCAGQPTLYRLDHLWDHLAENHGYDRARLDYSVNPRHLGRKKVLVLKGLFVRDARKVARDKARITAAEEIIQQLHPSYVSCHGLDLSMNCSVNDAEACTKKQGLVTMIVDLRTEMQKKGLLYGQSGHVNGSWEEIYEDLVSFFQLDEDTQEAVGQRAEVVYGGLQTSIHDDDAPLQVGLTDPNQLVPGAFLPPK